MGGDRHDLSARLARYGAIIIWVVAATGATLPQQPQPRTPGAQAPATASIAGRLLDATTGQPIGGGVVVLREFASRGQRVVSTSDTGEFVIVDLPAAIYSLHASALRYVGRQYGQRHALDEGVPIELRTGETRRQVDVALLPGGGIAGRVTTQDGQPLAFADVEALRPQVESNLRVLVPLGRAGANALGEFHLAGLPPGHYYVAAIDPADEGTEDATGQIHWAQTFYPGTSSPAAAQRVRLSSGETRTAIDFPLLGVSRVSVRGRLTDPDDSDLAAGSVILSPESDEGLALGRAQAGVVRPDGTFEFANVSPGDYRLRASARTFRQGPALYASFHLEVHDVDISNAVLFLNRGASISGQVEIAGGATEPQPVLTNLWVSAPMADGSIGSGQTRSLVRGDGSFNLATPEGNRVIRLGGLPDPWSLEAVFYQGRNVIDVPFVLRSGEERERIRLVLTDRASRLVGVVQDEDGNAITDRAIVALPVNSAFWRPGDRHIRLTYPDLSGRYELVGLPAGVYLVAAVAGISTGDLYDPAIFQEIAAAGTEALVETGETTTLDLVLPLGGNR